MFETIIKKGAHYFVNQLERVLPANYYTQAEITEKIKHFRLKKIAILIDGQTDIKPLLALKGIEKVGLYSFDLNLIDTTVLGFKVQPLLPGSTIRIDGWVVSALNALTSFSLNQYLLENKTENQIIIQHVKYQNGTKYYSYVDFFNQGQRTIVQINNYFRRCYANPFPLDLRLTFRDCRGDVVKTMQIIIPPDALRVITSDDLPVKNFVGYLEVEFEISKKVMPFLHYMVDYISPEFISSNHQSGLGLHPAQSAFTRGYIPTKDEDSLVVCLFQRNYSEPVKIKAVLNYFDHGRQITLEKYLKPLKKNQMLYQDIKELFNKVDFTKISSPYAVIKADVPLHRPNFYYSRKGKKGYYDTSHAGPDLNNYIKGIYGGVAVVTDAEKSKLRKYNCVASDLKYFLLPPEMKIESVIALGNDTTIDQKIFTFDFYNTEGKLVHSFKKDFDYDYTRYFNISNYLLEKGIKDFAGTCSLRPTKENMNIPILTNGIAGYLHKNNPYLTSTAASGSEPANIPFYYRGGPPCYTDKNSVSKTIDIFARGISSDVYDTFYIISFLSANKNLKQKAKVEIQLVNVDGEKMILYKYISAHGCLFLKLSDLIKETKHASRGGYYTVWFFSSDAYLYGQHILYRKKDHAISVEHCYVGKYGV